MSYKRQSISYGGAGLRPALALPPGAGELAAQIATSMLQQSAMAQHVAQYAMSEAHIAGLLHAQLTEAQKMIIPEETRPVHRNTLKSILKKVRVVQPITPAPPTPFEQVMNADLANEEEAAVTHARNGGDVSTLVGRLIERTISASSAAS